MTAFLITWDWKDQPDWDRINEAISTLEAHGLSPRLFPVTTHSDTQAVVVGMVGMTREDAEQFYERNLPQKAM